MQMNLREFWNFAEKEGGLCYWSTNKHDKESFKAPIMWVSYRSKEGIIEVSLDKEEHFDLDDLDGIRSDFTSLGNFSKEKVEEILSPEMKGEGFSFDAFMDECMYRTAT